MRIRDTWGVCPVREDTEMLAAAAAEIAPQRALDLGTGTGYVAVYLALRGARVDAVDISPRALAAARANAARNGVAINVFASDLYAATKGTYDVIASNPPQRARETELSRFVTSTVLRSERVSNLVQRLVLSAAPRRRLELLERIARGALERLQPGGRLILAITAAETSLLLDRVAGLGLVERRHPPNVAGVEIAIFVRDC